MRRLRIIALALLWLLPLAATAQEDDRGFLQRTLEDALSDAGRTVRIVGFEGALSSQATLEELTIEDDQGVWLTLRDVTLDWSRVALLRGRLEVEKLSAGEILLPRLPVTGDGGGPAPEASGFSLPELPVSVRVGELSAGRISIGAPVFGLAVDMSLLGSLELADGQGRASLTAERLDAAQGRFALDAGFANASRQLSLSLLVEEEPGGILSTLLALPGGPSVRLSVTGDAPLSDFTAEIALATDGADRLAGQVEIADLSAETPTAGRRFAATLSGDVTPLFAPDYREFFGPDVALDLEGTMPAEGGLDIGRFDLNAQALALNGRLLLSPGGLPERIAVRGRIGARDGEPVLLPLSGEPTRVGSVDLDISYDQSEGERWTALAEIKDLDRTGFRARSLRLDGEGRIGRGADADAFVTSAFDFAAEALDLGSEAAEAALGETVKGRAEVDWRAGQPVAVKRLDLTGETYEVGAAGTVDLGGGDILIDADATVSARDLSVFSGLASRPLQGAVTGEASILLGLLSGRFDVVLETRTNGLQVGLAELDGILGGQGDLSLIARRDETGTFLDRLTVATDAAEVEASAELRTGASKAEVKARLQDASLVVPELSGPVSFEGRTQQTGSTWAIVGTLDGEALDAALDGTIDTSGEVPEYRGEASFAASDLTVLAPYVGRPLAGAASVKAAGAVTFDLARAEATATVATRDLITGIAQADALLAGAGRLDLTARRDGPDLFVEAFDLRTDAVTATGRGAYQTGASRAEVTARFTEAGQLLPGLSGPVAFEGRTQETDGLWAVVAKADGSGIDAAVDGLIDLNTPTPQYRGTVEVAAGDLSVLSELAGRPLGGALTAEATGTVGFDLGVVDVVARGEGQSLRTGIAEADRILAGTSTFEVDAGRDGTDIAVRRIRFDSPLLKVTAEGRPGEGGQAFDFDALLANVQPFVPDLSGALSARGTAALADGDWALDVSAEGPGNSSATIRGTVAEDFTTADLAVAGRAPLALANRALSPRSIGGTAAFDLRVNGPLALGAVSGRVTTEDARFVDPGAGIALDAVGATVDLAGGGATIDLSGAVRNGGRLSVAGPVGLTAPFPAELGIRLDRVALRDPTLYETSIDGTVAVSGPLAGGASISGRLDLGATEVRIPSGGATGAGDIPEIRHVGEPSTVRATRDRAGLLNRGGSADGGATGPGYSLDLFIVANNQIFIRGRGLDAELGGRLRVEGTTNAVVPDGQFDLIRGRLDIFGRRLVLNEGNVTLRGDFDAFVRLEAVTDVEDVTIRVVVEGPITDPSIRFLSEPELPDDEVVARLLFGRGIETLSPIQAAQLAASIRTLSGAGGEGFLGSIRETTGLDDFDVTTSTEGTAQVRAGRYLSDDVYTDVTIDSTGQTEVNLNFDLSPRVTLKGSVTSEGETGVGIFFKRDY